MAYIGIQPISSGRRVSIKATNSSWFAKRPASIVTPPQRTALPKSVKPIASPKAKEEKAILFSVFDSILASYKEPPVTTDSAPITGKPIIKPETKKPAPANPEILALFSKLKSLLADQSEPSEVKKIDVPDYQGLIIVGTLD